MKRRIGFLFLTMAFTSGFGQDQTLLLRFPAISNGTIAFSYAGDLYTVPQTGGKARKLTSHEGYEMFPRFSPDGRWLAFTGQYDGNTEVYIMPSEGGIPRRLTVTATLNRDDVSDRMGPNNIVMAWKNLESRIVFRSRMKSFNAFVGQLFDVSMDGGLPCPLPLPRGGFCSFSPDDRRMAYNRVFREFRTWKRYRGGMADDIWIHDFKTHQTVNLTQNPALDIIPMWSGNRIYFLSDRDPSNRMNLYVCDLSTKITRQLTFFTEFDIKFPSLGSEAIVFECGGALYRFDLAAEKPERVPVVVADDKVNGREGLADASRSILTADISPDGKRALFGARGDMFTVPIKQGQTRNLTRTSGVHERNGQWSPDGRWIGYVSDASGEDEITIQSQDGNSPPVQITREEETYKYAMVWSPDSRKILWSDRLQRLRWVDVESRQIHEIDQAHAFEIREYVWSPDSKWIAYVKPEEKGMDRLILHSLDKGTNVEATDGWYSVSQPEFSSDGKYLFFTSNRDYSPTYSWTEWNHIYQDMSRIYLMTLAKATKSPFEPKSDEVEIKKATKEETKKGKDKKDSEAPKEETKPPDVLVDVDGLMNRIAGFPVPASNYFGLGSAGETLYCMRRGSKDEKARLLMFDLSSLKETEIGTFDSYRISADRKKMLVRIDQVYAIVDLPKAKITPEEKLDLAGLQVRLSHRDEWIQVFDECWRQMRASFYAPNMHGVDWPAVRAKYRPLVSHVNHGADLAYIVGEMIGELSCGHTYVTGGDMPKARRLKTGLLGAELEKDQANGSYRIVRILPGQNWTLAMRSPLTELGVDVKVGDFILAVDGRPTRDMANIYDALVNTEGKQVRLTVSASSSGKDSRDVVVVPIGDESDLYYYDWVETNIRKVTQASKGKVGYIHVPDMGARGLNEFIKHFTPQLEKKALIIDVRGNGGGNVSPMLIERLRREIAMIGIARNTTPTTSPGSMVWGPKVCLIDEFSASDGDLFPFQFRQYNLGKLIGKRTWGGVVGIRGSLPLLDGSTLNVPEFSRYDVQGREWVIEGVGVEPDIFVDNDPAREWAGTDDQLNKAIEVILEELKTQERTIPPPPPYPDKTPKGNW